MIFPKIKFSQIRQRFIHEEIKTKFSQFVSCQDQSFNPFIWYNISELKQLLISKADFDEFNCLNAIQIE